MIVQYHPKQWQLLQNMALRKRVPHALLFTGVSGLGKKEVAFQFAKQLLCKQKDKQSPCSKCFSCQLAEKRQHPDLILVAPEKNEIQIDQIRQLQQALALTPRYGDFKCSIIIEAQLMNGNAQNAFLKVLEETPGQGRFILVSSQPQRLFSTIRSRVQVIKFFPLSTEQIVKITGREPDSGASEWAQLSWGRPARAQQLLEEPEFLEKERQRIVFVSNILKAPPSKRMAWLNQVFKNKETPFDLNCFLEVLVHYYRICLLQNLSAISQQQAPACFEALPQINKKQASEIKDIIDQILKLKILAQTTNIEPRLALEHFFIKI